jgi:hypothetical protein
MAPGLFFFQHVTGMRRARAAVNLRAEGEVHMSTAQDLGHLPASLDDLAALGPEELAKLYREARTPAIRDIDGDMKGRMLASPLFASGVSVSLTRRLGALKIFPWRGKSLHPLADDRGEGINRVLRDEKPWKWFRFETSIGRSRAGDFDAFQLNYDLHENPWLIRRIKDEVREVAPGLWLGQAYFESRGKPTLVLYFALEKPRA